MEYAIESKTPDLKHTAAQFHQQHLRYEEMCRRTGRERADQAIEHAFRTLQMVDV